MSAYPKLKVGAFYKVRWLDHSGSESWDDESEPIYPDIETGFFNLGRKKEWLRVAAHYDHDTKTYTDKGAIVLGAVIEIIEFGSGQKVWPIAPSATPSATE